MPTKEGAQTMSAKNIPEENILDSKHTKDNLFCVLEELRLRRKIEAENTAKYNSLLKEKYEISREKDEILCQSEMKIASLKKENAEIAEKLAAAIHKLEELETRKMANEDFNKQGTKSLQDEVIAQQLARHSLEKKLKEQDCRFELQMKAEENLSKRIKDLEEKIHAIEKDRDLVKNEILNLESNAQKASFFQNKIMRINRHRQCEIQMYQEKASRALSELSKLKAQLHNAENEKKSSMTIENSDVKQGNVKQEMLLHQLEMQITTLKKENTELLGLLLKQSNQVNEMSKRLSTLSATEMALHFEIDDLQAEVKRFASKPNEEAPQVESLDHVTDAKEDSIAVKPFTPMDESKMQISKISDEILQASDHEEEMAFDTDCNEDKISSSHSAQTEQEKKNG